MKIYNEFVDISTSERIVLLLLFIANVASFIGISPFWKY